MKRVFAFILLGVVPALLAEPTPAATSAPVTARSKVLDLAGAFANDGYKIRDGYWSGALEPAKPLFLEVNLFSGNEYWFSVAALPPAQKLTVEVFDQKGVPIKGEFYQEGPRAAAGLIAQRSGRYFVKISMTDGAKAEYCMVYSYK